MRLFVALLLSVALLSGCSDKDGGADEGSSSSTSTSQGIVAQPGEVSISVAAVGAYPVNPAFDPASMEVPAGAIVHVTFRNADTGPLVSHNWVVEGIPNATSDNIQPGASTTLDFTAPAQAGEHVYYCSIGDHRARGMEGTLSVTVS